MSGTWDMGDLEPECVTHVHDDSDDDGDGNSSHWGRTVHGEWKGYKTGYKTYLDWPGLVRRWGPVREVEECP